MRNAGAKRQVDFCAIRMSEYIVITVRGQRDGRQIPTSSPAR